MKKIAETATNVTKTTATMGGVSAVQGLDSSADHESIGETLKENGLANRFVGRYFIGTFAKRPQSSHNLPWELAERHAVQLSRTPSFLPYQPRKAICIEAFAPPRRRSWLHSWSAIKPLACDSLVRDERLAVLEAILFAADEPLSPRRLAQIVGLSDGHEARRLAKRLGSLLTEEASAFEVREVAGGFQLLSKSEFRPWLVRARLSPLDVRISAAARETLAVIAYRQPTMRAEIEEIRGVHCGELLRWLLEKGLVRIVGRHPSLGRPVLYGTTRKFLQTFGLRNLEELPPVQETRGSLAASQSLLELPADPPYPA